MINRAIVLVPGFTRRPQFEARDMLCDALLNYGEGYQIAVADRLKGDDFVKVTVRKRGEGPLASIHVYEAFWGDLVPPRGDESPFGRFRRASSLLLYWGFGGLVRAAISRRLPGAATIALVVSALGLLVWYLSVLSVLVQAWSQVGLPDPVGQLGVLFDADTSQIVATLAIWLDRFNNLAPVIFVFGIFTFLGGVEKIAAVADYVKCYLQDRKIGDHPAGIRARTRQRCERRLDQLLSEELAYDDVYIVAHSLGGVIALDTLAGFGGTLERVRLVTWGAAMGALSLQRADLKKEIDELLMDGSTLSEWIDVVFTNDFMASRVPVEPSKPPKKLKSLRPVHPDGNWLTLNFTGVHEDYYKCEGAISCLLDLSAAESAIESESGKADGEPVTAAPTSAQAPD